MRPPISSSRTSLRSGFTLVEMMVSSTIFSLILGAIAMGFVSFTRTFSLAKDYAAARLTLSDYINLDLRRSTDFQPTFVPDDAHDALQDQPLFVSESAHEISRGQTHTLHASAHEFSHYGLLSARENTHGRIYG